MNFMERWKKTARNVGLMVMVAAGLSACGDHWKEEVLLHDGSKIVVERSVSRGGRHEIGQKPPYKEQRLSFALPGKVREISWDDHFSKDIGSANFLPMLLDLSNGTPYLVVSPMGCLSYNKWGRPNPPYVIFKHDGKEWIRIPIQEFPAEITKPNLIFSAPDIEVEKRGTRFMNAEMIQHIINGYRQPEYKTILREPLAETRIKEMCRVEFSNGKGTWLSSDWFSEAKDLAACTRVCDLNGFNTTTCPCGQFFKGN